MDGALQNFGRIAIAACMDVSDPYAYLQKFTYTRGATKIKVATSYGGKDFCLDLGTVRGRAATVRLFRDPPVLCWSSGPVFPLQNLHLYECVNVPQQQFWITDDAHIALEGELDAWIFVGRGWCSGFLQVIRNASMLLTTVDLNRAVLTEASNPYNHGLVVLETQTRCVSLMDDKHAPYWPVLQIFGFEQI
jgi:hypothetical protein